MVGIDAVAVLMCTPPDGDSPEGLTQPGYGGFAGEPPAGSTAADLDELLRAHQPVRLRIRRGPAPGLRDHYAGQHVLAIMNPWPVSELTSFFAKFVRRTACNPFEAFVEMSPIGQPDSFANFGHINVFRKQDAFGQFYLL